MPKKAKEFQILLTEIKSVALSRLNASSTQPFGLGVTRLGKTEILNTESRHEDSHPNDALNWIKESLSLRIRASRYSSAAYVSFEETTHSLTIIHFRGEHEWGAGFKGKIEAKQKRPGHFTLGQVNESVARKELFLNRSVFTD